MITKQKIICGLIAFLLCANLILAIGIRPAKTSLHTEGGGLEYEGEFWVVNMEGKEFTANIYVDGEMAQYVKVEEKEISFTEDDEAKQIKFKVKIPETVSVPPGTSTANVVVEEILSSNEPNVISSIIVIKHKIIIEGPYPDKYIITKLNFQDQGDTVEFVSEVENLGKKDIGQVQTKFYVNDKKQNPVVKETETTDLKKSENKLLKTTLKKDLFELGEFEVSALTTYDDQKVEIVKKLVVGKPGVDITYFDPYFIANKINQYTMDLLNKWNKQIKNVYVDVEVKKDNQKIDQFRTKSTDIEGLVSKRIQDYFDAREKSPGKYTFNMVVNFWDNYRMETKTFQSELLTESEYGKIDVSPPGNLAGAATGKTGGDSIYKTIVWVIMGILISAVGFYIFYRYRNREQEE
ncbi:MAG: hypothetical protein V1865_03290 [bacterium]